MIQTNRIAFLFLVAVIAMVATPACSAFNSACADAMPVLNNGQALLSDAQLALAEAETAIQQLPEQERSKAQGYIDAARAGLRASASGLAAASTACSQPTVTEVFDEFIQVWASIRGFLSIFGGAGAASVRDPIVYGMVAR